MTREELERMTPMNHESETGPMTNDTTREDGAYRKGDKCRTCGGEMVFEHKTTPWCRQCEERRSADLPKLFAQMSAHPTPGARPVTPNVVIISDWPAQMRKETAAAYVDAQSTQAFDRAVKAGTYPRPYNRPGEGLRWLRSELDAALARTRPPAEEPPLD